MFVYPVAQFVHAPLETYWFVPQTLFVVETPFTTTTDFTVGILGAAVTVMVTPEVGATVSKAVCKFAATVAGVVS